MRKIDCRLIRCDPIRDEHACGLLQMEHSVSPEILYSAYWYRSGTNATMRNHLQEISESAREMVDKDQAVVLDIGCNDGTLLKNYPEDYARYGVDPSDVAASIQGDIRVFQDLFPSQELEQALGSTQFDIITSIAMFYDLEDPVSFCRAISARLEQNGIWIIEMSYMPMMLEMISYDTICHEHLEYYSLAVIENIMERAGLKVVRAQLNNINGGSLRCYITHKTSFKYKNEDWAQTLVELRQKEFDLELDTDKPYRHFQDQINAHREELRRTIIDFKKQGKTIHIYGASTKGNTILQWCGIDHSLIDYAAERNPDKFGALTIGTDIPIISEEDSRAMNPDFYLVLPWHFQDEFIEREKEMLKKGTGMIFPIPDVRVVTADDV